ncbi:MAG: hypothetical protein ACRD2Z_09270 [Thermoanaerobaculia bacterium]
MTADPVSPEGEARQRTERHAVADTVLDELIPEQLDWRDLVVRYPLPALLVAALGGYWLGSRRGRDLTSAAAAFAGERVDEQVTRFMGRYTD